MQRLICIVLFLLAAQPAFAFDLTVVSYNVESDADTDPATSGGWSKSIARTCKPTAPPSARASSL